VVYGRKATVPGAEERIVGKGTVKAIPADAEESMSWATMMAYRLNRVSNQATDWS
jgi:hypothetical protein